jgi:hypothetical protein
MRNAARDVSKIVLCYQGFVPVIVSSDKTILEID